MKEKVNFEHLGQSLSGTAISIYGDETGDYFMVRLDYDSAQKQGNDYVFALVGDVSNEANDLIRKFQVNKVGESLDDMEF